MRSLLFGVSVLLALSFEACATTPPKPAPVSAPVTAPHDCDVSAVESPLDQRICVAKPVAAVPKFTAAKPFVPEQYRCEQPSDCVLSCPTPKGCCSNPCGCQHAINRRFVAAYEQEVAKECQHPPHCPAYGCAYQPAFGATCEQGRCVSAKGPGF